MKRTTRAVMATAMLAHGPGAKAMGPPTSTVTPRMAYAHVAAPNAGTSVAIKAREAAKVFGDMVQPLSHPRALETAFGSYYAFKESRPADVRKPYLYFVDYGLPSNVARGYVFDMDILRVVEGPFLVAHGRGSGSDPRGVPLQFSNRSGSLASSLGLYLARETYDFHGSAGGRHYRSIGLRLDGLSPGFNDNARERRVVAHGAPYVTATRAGRSEGCPAMEPERAARLLPKLADGAMVFLFAPQQNWLQNDQWVVASES